VQYPDHDEVGTVWTDKTAKTEAEGPLKLPIDEAISEGTAPSTRHVDEKVIREAADRFELVEQTDRQKVMLLLAGLRDRRIPDPSHSGTAHAMTIAKAHQLIDKDNKTTPLGEKILNILEQRPELELNAEE